MDARRIPVALVVAMAMTAAAGAALAQSPDGSGFGSFTGASSFTPRVPVSAFARPASWLDVSRLHVSTTVSVGTGFGGKTEGLQVTSLSYQMAGPLAVRVSLGNAFGASAAQNGHGMFLEGFQVAYQPFSSMRINVDYRDFRSPLQYNSYYSRDPGFGPFGR
jgi:hypothetical protein